MNLAACNYAKKDVHFYSIIINGYPIMKCAYSNLIPVHNFVE